jgi:exodeoxyribonuclease V alpha subunit
MNQNNKNIDPILFQKCPPPIKSLVENASRSMQLLYLDFFSVYDFCEWEPQILKSILPAVILHLFAEQNIGSTCLNLNDPHLIESLKSLGIPKAEKAVGKLIADIKANKYQKIISDQTTDFLPLFLIERDGFNYLYLNKNWDAENKINQKLRSYAAINSKVVQMQNQTILEGIYRNSPREFNADQKKAIEFSLLHSFVILTGGPGTGKTFTLTGILRGLLGSGIAIHEIALAAPTAKAANRMNESISENVKKIAKPTKNEEQLYNLKGTTIHRLLGLSTYVAESQYSELYPLPFKVLVIDEASMIDLYLMKTLISSVDIKQTKLILIGDKDQLPSVDEGAVFSDLIENNSIKNVVTLNESYRSHGKLLTFIKSIKNKTKGDDISLPTFPNMEVFLNVQEEPVGLLELNSLNKEQYANEIKYWVRRHFLDAVTNFTAVHTLDFEKIKTYLNQINETKILSVINNGIYGVDGLNQFCMDEILNSTTIRKSNHYFHGMPIQILKNNNYIELYNGDIGVIMKNEDHYFQAVFMINNQLKVFAIEKLPAFQMSFATTVHKGQGSEYDHVLLVIPPEGVESVASKQLLYTGISRAKKKCLIFSSKADLQKSLDNEIKRTSGVRI